jgi:hypothetical protein
VRTDKATSVLRLRLSEVRDVFDTSASDNLITPSLPMSLAVLSENEMKMSKLHRRLSSVRDEFDLSASNNLITRSGPMSLSVLYVVKM